MVSKNDHRMPKTARAGRGIRKPAKTIPMPFYPKGSVGDLIDQAINPKSNPVVRDCLKVLAEHLGKSEQPELKRFAAQQLIEAIKTNQWQWAFELKNTQPILAAMLLPQVSAMLCKVADAFRKAAASAVATVAVSRSGAAPSARVDRSDSTSSARQANPSILSAADNLEKAVEFELKAAALEGTAQHLGLSNIALKVLALRREAEAAYNNQMAFLNGPLRDFERFRVLKDVLTAKADDLEGDLPAAESCLMALKYVVKIVDRYEPVGQSECS